MKNYNYSKRYKDNINKINNTTRKNIVSVKIKPRNNNAENNFGGKIREKKIILYMFQGINHITFYIHKKHNLK